jgi:hypothetical protein
MLARNRWTLSIVASLAVVSVASTAVAQEQKQEPTDALRFTGNDYVELVGTRGMLDLNGSFTIETWVRWDTEFIDYVPILGDHAWPGMNPDLQVRTHCGLILRGSKIWDADKRAVEIALGATGGGKTDWFYVQPKPRKETDSMTWHHLAACKTKESVTVFLDGKLTVRKPCQGIKFHNCPTNLFLGGTKYPSSDTQFSWREMKGLRISKNARYSESFKPSNVFPKDETTLVLLNFDRIHKDTILDVSGNKHDGTLVGAKWVDLRLK